MWSPARYLLFARCRMRRPAISYKADIIIQKHHAKKLEAKQKNKTSLAENTSNYPWVIAFSAAALSHRTSEGAEGGRLWIRGERHWVLSVWAPLQVEPRDYVPVTSLMSGAAGRDHMTIRREAQRRPSERPATKVRYVSLTSEAFLFKYIHIYIYKYIYIYIFKYI